MNYVEDLRKLVGHRPLILVGSVVIIIDACNRILLQKRSTSPNEIWGLPGGLMELGESTEYTAKREVFEETGLTLGTLTLIDIFSGYDYFVRLSNKDEFYSVTAAYYTNEYQGEIIVDHIESLDVAFYSFDQLPENIVKSHNTIIDRYKSMIKERI